MNKAKRRVGYLWASCIGDSTVLELDAELYSVVVVAVVRNAYVGSSMAMAVVCDALLNYAYCGTVVPFSRCSTIYDSVQSIIVMWCLFSLYRVFSYVVA